MPPSTHSHGPVTDSASPPDPTVIARRRRAVRLMLVVLVPIGVATLVGLVALWPSAQQTAAVGAADAGDFAPTEASIAASAARGPTTPEALRAAGLL